MPFSQDVGVCLPPALVSGFLSEHQQLLALAARDSVELQKSCDISGLQVAPCQSYRLILAFDQPRTYPNVFGSLPRTGAETMKLGGKTPTPRRWASEEHLGTPSPNEPWFVWTVPALMMVVH